MPSELNSKIWNFFVLSRGLRMSTIVLTLNKNKSNLELLFGYLRRRDETFVQVSATFCD